MPEPLADALARLRPLLLDCDGLVRAVAAGRRRGHDQPASARLRPVDVKGGRCLQVVRDVTAGPATVNLPYDGAAGEAVTALLGEPFGTWHVETRDATVQLRVTKRGEAQVHQGSAQRGPASTAHDRRPEHLLDPGDPLFDAVGGGAAKRRQVDAFLRALEPALPAVAGRTPLRVVDLGCGNAYLTFGVHRYLTGVRRLEVDLVGVDQRPQARERNSAIARDLGWTDSARFVAGTILEAPVQRPDVVLALHACDTATDEALARAVRWGSTIVLAAPCCHHDLQAQLRAPDHPGPPRPYALLTRHPLLAERFVDSVTDAVRAALLRLLGYRVEVLEFVDSAHTARNVLLRATRTGVTPDAALVEDYRALTQEWSIRPALARLLEPELAPVLGR